MDRYCRYVIMDNRLIALVAVAVASCGRYYSDTDPGDAQAVNWTPPERECPDDAPVIDCDGGNKTTLDVRESCTTVRNCHFESGLRIYGPARNGEEVGSDWSRSSKYVAEIREQAPHHVTIENCSFDTNGAIPIYVGPGVTYTTIRDVDISGPSRSVMIYLDAESYGTDMVRVRIDASDAEREAIAIDASEHNSITDSEIVGGGIYLYRNCGEGGTVRHTTPSHNVIVGNEFSDAESAVWLSSRDDDWKAYCAYDDWGGDGGSSESNWSHARWNTVTDNDLGGGRVLQGESAEHNTVEDNR